MQVHFGDFIQQQRCHHLMQSDCMVLPQVILSVGLSITFVIHD